MTGRRRRTDDRLDADRSVLRGPGADRGLPRLTRTVIRGRCRLTGRLGRVSPAVTRARGYRRVVDRLGRVPRAVTRRAIRNDPADQRSQAPTRRVIRGCRPVTCRHDPAAASARQRWLRWTNLGWRAVEGPVGPPPIALCRPPVTRPHPHSGWTARLVQRWSTRGNPGPPCWCRRRGVEWLARQPPPSAASSDAASCRWPSDWPGPLIRTSRQIRRFRGPRGPTLSTAAAARGERGSIWTNWSALVSCVKRSPRSGRRASCPPRCPRSGLPRSGTTPRSRRRRWMSRVWRLLPMPMTRPASRLRWQSGSQQTGRLPWLAPSRSALWSSHSELRRSWRPRLTKLLRRCGQPRTMRGRPGPPPMPLPVRKVRKVPGSPSVRRAAVRRAAVRRAAVRRAAVRWMAVRWVAPRWVARATGRWKAPVAQSWAEK
jgi:hypothetical protein